MRLARWYGGHIPDLAEFPQPLKIQGQADSVTTVHILCCSRDKKIRAKLFQTFLGTRVTCRLGPAGCGGSEGGPACMHGPG